MTLGLVCEDCGEVVWPTTTPGELRWLRDRRHVVREVASHLQSGPDGWMVDALAFLDDHADHGVAYCER